MPAITVGRLAGISDGVLARSEALWLPAAIATVALGGAILLAIGPSYIAAPWDVFVLLDGAWRILNGQIPHADFHNPIGALAYAVFALGMKIDGPSLQAYAYGNSLFLVVVGLWSIAISRNRLTPVFGFLLTAFIVALIAATRPLGYDPATTTYAMIYNRYGWALLSILMVQLFLPPRSGLAQTAVFESVSAGLLLGLMFYCKITFFILGCGAYAFALLLRSELRKPAWMSLAAFVTVCIGAWVALGISVEAYVSDILVAGESQSAADRVFRLARGVKDMLPQIALLGIYWLFVIAIPNRAERRLSSDPAKMTLVLALIVGGGIFLTVGNTGEAGDVPLLGIAALILSEYAVRLGWAPGRSVTTTLTDGRSLAVLGLPLALLAGIFINDVRSLVNSFAHRADGASQIASSQRFEAEPLRNFNIPQWSEWTTAYWLAKEVPANINDGLSLLRRHPGQGNRTFVFAETDPFSFALGVPSVKGVPLWWDLNLSHGAGTYPAPDSLFADVDRVMIPILDEKDKGCCKETVEGMLHAYGPYLKKQFVEVDRSDHWVLLRRLDSPVVQQ